MFSRSISLCLLALAAPFAPAQNLEFQPKAGQSWLRTQQTTIDLEFDDIEMTINGQPSESSALDVRLNAISTFQVKDTVIDWKSADHCSFEREYLQLTRSLQAPMILIAGESKLESELRAQGEAKLQGERIQFSKKKGGNAWIRAYVEDLEIEDAELREVPEVNADFDFACLLPPDHIKVGGTWTVDPAEFLTALMASRGLTWDFETEAESDLPMWMGSIANQPEVAALWDDLKNAKVSCKLMPRRKAGRLSLYEVRVSTSFSGDCDLTEWAMGSLVEQEDETTSISVGSAFQSTVLSGSGTYQWNTDTRMMHSFRYSGDARFSRSQSILVQAGEEEMDIQLNCDGRFSLEVKSNARH